MGGDVSVGMTPKMASRVSRISGSVSLVAKFESVLKAAFLDFKKSDSGKASDVFPFNNCMISQYNLSKSENCRFELSKIPRYFSSFGL